MKNKIKLLAIFLHVFFLFEGCTRYATKDSIPCENYGILYNMTFKEKLYYLPDSLGGVSVNGRIVVKVFFDSKKQTHDFAITNIRLFKDDSLFYNFYEYYSIPIDKSNYDIQVAKYYDFVNDFLNNKVYFRKNKLPKYCDNDVSISYFIPLAQVIRQ